MAMALRFYPLQLSSLQYRFEAGFIRDHQCAGILIKDSDDVFPCTFQMPVCFIKELFKTFSYNIFHDVENEEDIECNIGVVRDVWRRARLWRPTNLGTINAGNERSRLLPRPRPRL